MHSLFKAWRLARHVAFWATVTVIGAVGGNFFISLADERGWYKSPSARVDALIAWLPSIVGSSWFPWVSGGVVGFTIGAWLDTLFIKQPMPVALSETQRNVTVNTSTPRLIVTEAPKVEPKPATEPKLFVDKPFSFFSQMWKGNNSLQAKALIQPYVGMYVRIDGLIMANNINENPGVSFSVGLTTTDCGAVICIFPIELRNYLARMDNKHPVRIAGQLTESTMIMNPLLIDCYPLE